MSSNMKYTERRLPDGWRWVKLGEVCELNPRRSLIERKESDPTSFIPMEAVDANSGMISDLRIRPYGEIKKGYTFFAEGDVLFAKITPCMQNGKHAIAAGLIDGIGFGTTEFHVLRPSQDVISELIWSFVRQPSLLIEATDHFTGAVGQQRLPQDYLANLKFPLPPLPEQRRIAGVLRGQMAAVEKARAAATARLEAVKALPAAFLRQTFPKSGGPLPSGWRWVKLRDVVDVRDGTHDTPQYVNKGIPLITSKNLKPEGIDFSNVLYISEEDHNQIKKRSGVTKEDILFAMIGTIGNPVIIETENQFSIKNVALFKFESSPVLNGYFYYLLSSRLILDQLDKNSQGGIQKFVSLAVLRNLQIPLPQTSEQQRIAGMLSEQMAVVDKARAAAEEELNAINALPAALLRRAFNGEL